MKEIFLTQGKITFVDDADYDWLNQWKWCAVNMRGNFYAMRNATEKRGRLISMSRQILGLEYRDPRQADHENHNTLDNRRDNIRICTRQQNGMNRKPNRNTASQFKGVCWSKQDKKWISSIVINGKQKHLGYFHSEIVAAGVYDQAAKEHFGKFACLNFN